MTIKTQTVKRLSNLLVLGVVMGLSACSGPGDRRPRPEPTELFSTSITEDGSKMFVYEVKMGSPPGPGGEGGGGRGGPPGGGGPGGPPGGGGGEGGPRGGPGGQAPEHIKSMFYDMLDEKLAQNGYCREGYLELESDFERGDATLRGECREAASEADRQQFPNQS